MKYQDKMFYRIVKPLLSFLVFFLFHPKVIGKENIPKEGALIFCGNHRLGTIILSIAHNVNTKNARFIYLNKIFAVIRVI